jgi:hypothetical protein
MSHVGHAELRVTDLEPFELYWEVERYLERDPALQSKLPNHPHKYTAGASIPGASTT